MSIAESATLEIDRAVHDWIVSGRFIFLRLWEYLLVYEVAPDYSLERRLSEVVGPPPDNPASLGVDGDTVYVYSKTRSRQISFAGGEIGSLEEATAAPPHKPIRYEDLAWKQLGDCLLTVNRSHSGRVDDRYVYIDTVLVRRDPRSARIDAQLVLYSVPSAGEGGA